MSARIPSTYAGAPKLSADARGALACARLVWDALTPAQRHAMRDMWSAKLTALGVLVREAGTRTSVEVGDAH